MARSIKIKEEQVTKALMKWLCDNGWQIICYDFPQSGTGKALHPSDTNSKTERSIIPDIVAYKNEVVVYFENKDRFYMPDFEKVSFLKNTTLYDKAFDILLMNYPYKIIYYGIGMPYTENNNKKAGEQLALIDFLTFVDGQGAIMVSYDMNNAFCV